MSSQGANLNVHADSAPIPESVMGHLRENGGPDRLINRSNALLWVEPTTEFGSRVAHFLKDGRYERHNVNFKITRMSQENKEGEGETGEGGEGEGGGGE
jgi:hypothetical protein